jgi:hypothetical protein
MSRIIINFLLGLVWLWMAGRHAEAAARYEAEGRRRVARWYLLGVTLAFVSGLAYLTIGETVANYCVGVTLAWLALTIAFEMYDLRRMVREHRARMARLQQLDALIEGKIDE